MPSPEAWECLLSLSSGGSHSGCSVNYITELKNCLMLDVDGNLTEMGKTAAESMQRALVELCKGVPFGSRIKKAANRMFSAFRAIYKCPLDGDTTLYVFDPPWVMLLMPPKNKKLLTDRTLSPEMQEVFDKLPQKVVPYLSPRGRKEVFPHTYQKSSPTSAGVISLSTKNGGFTIGVQARIFDYFVQNYPTSAFHVVSGKTTTPVVVTSKHPSMGRAGIIGFIAPVRFNKLKQPAIPSTFFKKGAKPNGKEKEVGDCTGESSGEEK